MAERKGKKTKINPDKISTTDKNNWHPRRSGKVSPTGTGTGLIGQGKTPKDLDDESRLAPSELTENSGKEK